MINFNLIKNRGFSLIEVLVVLVILGLFVGMVVLSIGDTLSRKIRSEGERFQSILMAATDEAIFSGSEFGFLLKEDGYQLLRFDPIAQGWTALPDKVYQMYTFDSSIVIDWKIDGFSRPDGDKWEEGDSDQFGFGNDTSALADQIDSDDAEIVALTPQLLVLSSGEISVFTVEFSAAENINNPVLVRIDSDGFSMPSIKTINLEES